MQENGRTKTTLCIKMLQLLSDGRVWKISELANRLETNPRNIVAYRQELQAYGYEDGYDIQWICGKNGGYQLKKNSIIPSLKLTEEEKKILLVANDYLKSRSDVFDYAKYQEAMSKVFSSISIVPDKQETMIIANHSLLMDGEELQKRYTAIETCIAKKRKISIDYLSADNVVRTRVLCPYELFIHNNAWYVIGYCELAKGIRWFKLNRIEDFNVLDYERFRQYPDYDRSKYFDARGFKGGMDWNNRGQDGSTAKAGNGWVHIKLELSGRPAMYVKEYKNGENQVITPIDKDTTILECDMQYVYNTIKFVLGFGTDCKVLEPEWLKEEVLEIARQMLERQD